MNQQCNHLINKRIGIISFLLAFFLNQSPLQVTGQHTPANQLQDSAIVQFLRIQQNQCIVKLQFNGREGTYFKILLSGNTGYVFFQGVYPGNPFSRTFQLPLEDSTPYLLQLKNLQTNEWQSFVIDINHVTGGVVKKAIKENKPQPY